MCSPPVLPLGSAGPSTASEPSGQGRVPSGTQIGPPPSLGLSFPGRGRAVVVMSFLLPCPWKASSSHPVSLASPASSTGAWRSRTLLCSGLGTPCPSHSGDHRVSGEPHDAQASGGFHLKAPRTCLLGLPGCRGPSGPVETLQQVLGDGGQGSVLGPGQNILPKELALAP